MIRVTNRQYFFHPTLKYNLDTLIMNNSNDFDFMIPITGGGNVRVGKTVLALSCGHYTAHTIGTPFSLEKNVVFNGKDLIENAFKVPKQSVFVYDEAREGLNTKKFFSQLTQQLLDFFSECGMLNHFLYIVLPDYFELPRGIAVNRSIALIDVFYKAEKAVVRKSLGDIKKGQEYLKFNRGYFNFYNKRGKKRLYNRGKRDQDYEAAKPIFQGEFRNYWVVDKDKYEKKKLRYLRRERDQENKDSKIEQRNLAWKLLKEQGMTFAEIAREMSKNGLRIEQSTIRKAIGGVS